MEDSPFPAHVSKRPGVQRTLGFAKHTTFFGTVHAAIQQTNATLTPSMHRFSSQTPPWHGAYIDSADKRHLGTVHTAIQQTNATLAPHMCIFSGHAPRSRRSMELPHGQRPALKTHAAASHLTSPCLSGSPVHAPAIIRRPHHAVSTARMSLATRANASGCGACAAARKSWPTRANAAGCRPCQLRACP